LVGESLIGDSVARASSVGDAVIDAVGDADGVSLGMSLGVSLALGEAVGPGTDVAEVGAGVVGMEKLKSKGDMEKDNP
jgi:hypothetical protein